MPDWFIQILIQYPIVAIVGFVAWYASRKLERANDARISREQEIHATSIAELKAGQKEVEAAFEAEMAEVKMEIRTEFKRFGKKVDELIRRLNP
ncbi:MAG TPA: hypothetical protein VGL71_01500 [Urbifossiella sp.]